MSPLLALGKPFTAKSLQRSVDDAGRHNVLVAGRHCTAGVGGRSTLATTDGGTTAQELLLLALLLEGGPQDGQRLGRMGGGMVQSCLVVTMMRRVPGQEVGMVLMMLGKKAVSRERRRGRGSGVWRRLLEARLERFGRLRLLLMMLGKGGIKGSRDGNVVGSALLVLLMNGLTNGLLMKLRMVHGVGGVNTGRRRRDRRSHGSRGLHLGLNSRRQPSGETIPPCHEQLGIPAFALGDRVGPIGKRGFLVVLLLLLLLLLHLQLLLPGEELGVPALAVGDGLALGNLPPQDGLELRSALLDA